jgi:hypothetical protein
MESRHSASGNARLIGVQLSASNGQAAPEQIPQPIDTGDKRNTNGLPEKGYTFPAEQKRHCKVEGKRSS